MEIEIEREREREGGRKREERQKDRRRAWSPMLELTTGTRYNPVPAAKGLDSTGTPELKLHYP